MFPMPSSSFRSPRELRRAWAPRHRSHRYLRQHLRHSRWRCHPWLPVLSSSVLLWTLERAWSPLGRVLEQLSWQEPWPSTDGWQDEHGARSRKVEQETHDLLCGGRIVVALCARNVVEVKNLRFRRAHRRRSRSRFTVISRTADALL